MAFKKQVDAAAGKGLKGYRPAFTFHVSRRSLVVLPDGSLVPQIGMCLHEKGLDGVRDTGPKTSDVNEDPALLNLANAGRITLPHDMAVKAFGEERRGYIGQTLRGQEMQPYLGSEGEYWTDAWTRYDFVHGEPVRRIDQEGWRDFHDRVLRHLFPDGQIDDAYIEAAEARAPAVNGERLTVSRAKLAAALKPPAKRKTTTAAE